MEPSFPSKNSKKYFTNIRLKKVSADTPGKLRYDYAEKEKQRKIGTSALESETVFPFKFIRQDGPFKFIRQDGRELWIIDCPGFLDSKGLETDIEFACRLKTKFKRTNKKINKYK